MGRPIVTAITTLALMLTSGAPPGSAASPLGCRVRNADAGRTFTTLQAGVDAARRGDHLAVRGTCHGGTVIDKDLVIDGIESATSGKPTLSGARRDRVIEVEHGVRLKIRDLIITGGKATRGAGILNRGNLVLRDVIVRRCSGLTLDGWGAGGGVYNHGKLTMNGNSTIRRNFSNPGPGGIRNRGTLILNGSSSISRNSGIYIGGVVNTGIMTMNASSAISDNMSEYTGGVENFGTLVMNGSSIVNANYGELYGGGDPAAGIRIYPGGSLTMRDASAITGNEGGGLVSEGSLTGVTCGPGGNVHDNTWYDCSFLSRGG
jgi:hypothetical protein